MRMPPQRVLFQQHHKAGVRREKRQTLVWAVPRAEYKPWVHIPTAQDIRNLPAAYQRVARQYPKTQKPTRSEGNLLNPDYRFFLGAKEPSSYYSRCRACRIVLIGHTERVKHMQRYKCTNWLVQSYKVLNLIPGALVVIPTINKRECVACGAITADTSWGVPLCTKASCQEIWMFDDEMPCANLTGALVKVYEVMRPELERQKADWEKANASK